MQYVSKYKKVIACMLFIFVILYAGIYRYTTEKAQKEKYQTEISELEQIKQEAESYIRTQYQEFNNRLISDFDTIDNLYTKYWKALCYNDKQDFGINELIYLNDICNEYGIRIDVMLAIFQKESSFNSLAKNSSSSATGYGQLIDSTAKSMYENYLQLGTYDISKHRVLCTDKKLNIKLSCRLMKYNIDTYGNYWTAVERYYGHSNASLRYNYASRVSSIMYENYGTSLK